MTVVVMFSTSPILEHEPQNGIKCQIGTNTKELKKIKVPTHGAKLVLVLGRYFIIISL